MPPYRLRTVPGCGVSGSAAGGHLVYAELLEEKQAVGVGPVLGELAIGDAQGVSAGEGDGPADGLSRRAGEAAAVGAARLPPHHQVLVVGDRPDLDDELQVGQDGVDAADPPVEGLAAADLIAAGSGQRRGVGDEVLGDDLVGDLEVTVPQVFPRAGERGVGCIGHDGSFPGYAFWLPAGAAAVTANRAPTL